MLKVALILFTINSLMMVVYGAVEECYFCDNICEQPTRTQVCEAPVSRCYTVQVATGDATMVGKGCLSLDDAVVLCQGANEAPDSKCTLCDSNLCNDENNSAPFTNNTSMLMIILIFVLKICLFN